MAGRGGHELPSPSSSTSGFDWGAHVSVFALLPAAAWLFVVALGGTEASEHIEAVRWALAETGTGVGRGFFLFVVLPGAVGIYSLVAAAARRDAAARIIVAGLGFLLAILNLASWAA